MEVKLASLTGLKTVMHAIWTWTLLTAFLALVHAYPPKDHTKTTLFKTERPSLSAFIWEQLELPFLV